MLSPALTSKVLFQARVTASHSWEYGIVFEALLELHNPELSIFHFPFPIPTLKVEEVAALQYIKPFIRIDSTRLCEGNGMHARIYYPYSVSGLRKRYGRH